MLQRAARDKVLIVFVCVAVISLFGPVSTNARKIISNRIISLDVKKEQPLLEVSPTTVDTSANGNYVGDFITVTWKGLEKQQFDGGRDEVCYQNVTDHRVCYKTKGGIWIGLFTTDALRGSVDKPDFKPVTDHSFPRSQPFIDPAPLKWKAIYDETGQVDFNVINWRSDLVVIMFEGGTKNPKPMIASEVIHVKNKDFPSQGHLARTHDPTEMLISFNSRSNDPSACVRYGTSSGAYTKQATAVAHTFKSSDVCGAPANAEGWIDPGWMYDAKLTGLTETGQTIYYVYGSDKMGWSEESTFKVIGQSSPTDSLKIVAIADIGSTFVDDSQYHWMEPSSGAVAAAAASSIIQEDLHSNRTNVIVPHLEDNHSDADLALMIGDLSYATGYMGLWDNYMHMIEPLASRMPFMTGHGNHEKDFPNSRSFYTGNDSGGECGLPTTQRFRMPLPGDNQDAYYSWYSFEQGPVHFIMIDTEVELKKGSDQYRFIEEDLGSVDRSKTPWIIFLGHRPMYSIWGRDPHIGKVEDLMMKYKVDLALWGHGTKRDNIFFLHV